MIKSLPLSRLVLCAFLAATAWSAQSLVVEDCELDFLRLPKRVQATHYKLEIKVDPDQADFSGRVEIALKNDQNPNDVLCNNRRNKPATAAAACNRAKIYLSVAGSLAITDVAYQEDEDGSGLAIPVSRVCRSAAREMLVIELSREPSVGSGGKLELRFADALRDDYTGLFLATHRDSRSGEDKSVAMTQFESGHARKMFPCFDEPDFKATFELSVEHPAHLTAIANTRPVRQEHIRHENEPEKEYTKTYFGVTPKMSSYLLAFAVGEFDYVETSLSGSANITLGIYTPPGRSEEAQTSLRRAAEAYVALQEFFNVSQPVDKIDFVSCREFPGAMENWGLIAIEELSVLTNLDNYEVSNLHFSIVTIIHELAHQWFGNLVTLKWWDDLWLNEGFASWISNELANQLYPETDAKFVFLLKDMRAALALDSKLDRTHPIKNSQLQTIEEIEESFDEIAYEKANSVIRMLSDYVGQDKFRQGLRAYIKENQFGNTADSDLWRALSEASGLDVKQLMHSWIMQAGFPLISVKLNGAKLEVSQMRFPSAASGNEKIPKKQKKQTWVVPITLVVSNDAGKEQKIKFILGKKKDEIKLPSWFDLEKPGHWLKLNSGFQGFYRVHYETSALLDALRVPIETKLMQPADRLNVLEERLGLLKAGSIDEQQFQDMLTWFRSEDHDAVVDLISAALEYLELELDADERGLYSILTNYYEQSGRLSEIQQPNSTNTTTTSSSVKLMARADTLKRLVAANYEPAIKDALELFERASDGDGHVPVSLRDHVLSAVAKAGTELQFRQVLNLIEEIYSERMKETTVYYVREALRSATKNRRRLGKFNKQFPE